jgi:AraC-like DNA-binding protein
MTNHNHKTPNLPPSDNAFIIDHTRPVLTHSRNMHAETGVTAHSHARGQLLWATTGILSVTSNDTIWVVPPTHAVWIPSHIPHQVTSETDTQLRNLYIDPSYPIRQKEKSILMLTMSPLLREVILKLTDRKACLTDRQIKHLGLVAIDELEVLESFHNHIHSGQDPRLQRLINYIVQQPNQGLSLADLSKIAGASVRTIERLFKTETGMTYRQWRSRFKLMNSLALLTQGKTSTFVAHELGYKNVSSFIATFKAQFGVTPQEYIKEI